MTVGLAGAVPLDGWALAAIVLKALGYAGALLAIGAALWPALTLRAASDPVMGRAVPDTLTRRADAVARRWGLAAALVGLLALVGVVGLRAARLSGQGVGGALDPVMLGLVWSGPLGDAGVWRLVGFGLLAAGLSLARPGPARLGPAQFGPIRFGTALALIGALSVAVSYTQIGHTLGEPRRAMQALLTLHLLAAAFWIGSLAPLHAAANGTGAASLLERFGRWAVWIVAALAVAGAALSWQLAGGPLGLLGTAYGWALLSKLAGVMALLALAARNKLQLVPALARGEAGAGSRLRRAIVLEGAVVAVILLVTAALTSVTTPPVNL